MPSEPNPQTVVSLLIQKFSHPMHFFGRAGKAMDEEARRFGAVTQKEEGLCGGNDLRHGVNYSKNASPPLHPPNLSVHPLPRSIRGDHPRGPQ